MKQNDTALFRKQEYAPHLITALKLYEWLIVLAILKICTPACSEGAPQLLSELGGPQTNTWEANQMEVF